MSTATPVSPTTRQAIRLADGRELLYYDRVPGLDRAAPDLRPDLGARAEPSQVRWDPLFEEYAIIARHRQTRTFRPPASACPLCPSTAGRRTEIPATDYDVVVFENRFPAFAPGAGSGQGRCEVVCYSSDHHTSFAQLEPAAAAVALDALADRTRALNQFDGVEYVFCFENRGEEIGVTLAHPHGQIYGYPFVPPRFARAGSASRRHRRRTGECLQCQQLQRELRAGERIVSAGDEWVAYVPYAARWPYEVRVVPRRHAADLPGLDDEQRTALVACYQDVLRRFDRLFGTPAPYVAAWLQAPARSYRECWHLAAEVFTIRRSEDRLKYLAGAESAAATWVNDIPPELAAQHLRDAG